MFPYSEALSFHTYSPMHLRCEQKNPYFSGGFIRGSLAALSCGKNSREEKNQEKPLRPG